MKNKTLILTSESSFRPLPIVELCISYLEKRDKLQEPERELFLSVIKYCVKQPIGFVAIPANKTGELK